MQEKSSGIFTKKKGGEYMQNIMIGGGIPHFLRQCQGPEHSKISTKHHFYAPILPIII